MQTSNVPHAVPVQGIDDPVAAVRRAVRRPALRFLCHLQSQPTPDHGWILPQIEDGCHDEPFAVDAVENAMHEPSHEQTPKLTGVTWSSLGKLRGEVQCAPHRAIETITQPRHQFLVAFPRLEQFRLRSAKDDYFHGRFRSASRANVSSIGLACDGSAR